MKKSISSVLISSICFAISLLLIMPGCSSFSSDSSGIEPTELKEISKKISPKILYSFDLDFDSEEKIINISPYVYKGVMYLISGDGVLQAIDLEKGAVLWSVEAETEISSGILSDNNYLVAGGKEGKVFVFSRESGQLVWEKQLSSEVLAISDISEENVSVRTVDGGLYLIDLKAKKVSWVFERDLPNLTLRGASKPIIDKRNVIVGLDNGQLVFIDRKTGQVNWSTEVSIPSGRSDIERINDIDSNISMDFEKVYVASYQNRIAAYLKRTGYPAWDREISTYSDITLSEADKELFVTDSHSNVWALGSENGASIWLQRDLFGRRATAPAIFRDLLVVGDYDGYIHFLSRKDGEIIGRISIGDAIYMKPLVADGKVITIDSNGKVVVIGIE